jgi:hypothetical protein
MQLSSTSTFVRHYSFGEHFRRFTTWMIGERCQWIHSRTTIGRSQVSAMKGNSRVFGNFLAPLREGGISLIDGYQ